VESGCVHKIVRGEQMTPFDRGKNRPKKRQTLKKQYSKGGFDVWESDVGGLGFGGFLGLGQKTSEVGNRCT